MHITNVFIAAGIITSAIGLVAAFIAWVFKRGGKEQQTKDEMNQLKAALEENTRSNREVAGELRDFKATVLGRLENHEVRIAVLEDARSAHK